MLNFMNTKNHEVKNMSINLTTEAYEQLRSLLTANTPVRLNATQTGG
jgi:hypothetical protein